MPTRGVAGREGVDEVGLVGQVVTKKLAERAAEEDVVLDEPPAGHVARMARESCAVLSAHLGVV